MSNLGLGAMLHMLGGNEETVKAHQAIQGRKIKSIVLEDEIIVLKTSTKEVRIWDDGQSCCESRFITCDDDLKSFKGATFLGAEVREGGAVDSEHDDCHEMEFLVLKTDKGNITFETHVEHNGYYGGFAVVMRLM